MYQGPPWPPHRNHHFCYTSLLIFNISPPGPFSKSMGIINFCYTYKLKRSFSISQEIVASEHCAKKHQFFANQNHQKTIGFTFRIAPHRPQNSPAESQFSIIIFQEILNMQNGKVSKYRGISNVFTSWICKLHASKSRQKTVAPALQQSDSENDPKSKTSIFR